MRSLLVMFALFISCIGVYSERRRMSDFQKTDPADDYESDVPRPILVRHGDQRIRSTWRQNEAHFSDITAAVTAFKEVFVLELTLNSRLFASHYIEKTVTDDGEAYRNVDHSKSHCYYIGIVRDIAGSTAAISTCNGITGYFNTGNASFHIEPQTFHLHGQHVVRRGLPNAKSTKRCGNHLIVNDPLMQSTLSNTDAKSSFQWPQDGDKKDKVVELYIANDYSQFKARSSNVDAVYQRTKDIVNIASLAYQSLGIYMVLVGIEVWTDRDRFPILHSNVEGALESWYTYRMSFINALHYNDHGILITNVTFDNSVAGVAAKGRMCSNKLSGSLIMDSLNPAALAGSTLAHEMGHSFGLEHDDGVDKCNCVDPSTNNQCIMIAVTEIGLNQNVPTKWSSCSKNQFNISFSRGYDICLYNIPQTIFQPSSRCGNGIVEDGEQCDCGKASINECNSACCNNNTCKLTASAACASGRCCDTSTCKIKTAGTVCRAKSNDCDIPESCNGADALCPTDGYKPDGTDCKNIEAAYCYKGQCRSHRSQCELLWGAETKVSDSNCYTQVNSAGQPYGNCGFLWKNTSLEYLPCNAKDVMCGLLQCQDFSKALSHYQNGLFLFKPTNGSIGSSTCHSAILDLGTQTENPGLVPNGAKCGDRQMCVNQKCVNVEV